MRRVFVVLRCACEWSFGFLAALMLSPFIVWSVEAVLTFYARRADFARREAEILFIFAGGMLVLIAMHIRRPAERERFKKLGAWSGFGVGFAFFGVMFLMGAMG